MTQKPANPPPGPSPTPTPPAPCSLAASLMLKTLAPKVASVCAPRGGWAAPHRGTRQQRGYGSEWDRLRLRILARDQYLCQVCLRDGRVSAGNTVDHVVPKAESGSDDPLNLQAICVDCHKSKTQQEANRSRGVW